MNRFWLIICGSYNPRELARLRWLATMLDKATAPREA